MAFKIFVPLFFFPAGISGWNLIFSIRNQPEDDIKLTFVLRTSAGEELGCLPLHGYSSDLYVQGSPLPVTSSRPPGGAFVAMLPQAWHFISFHIPASPILIPRPGRYLLGLRRADGTEEIIGEFECVLVNPPPLTRERIAAIKSDPHAAKTLTMTLECNKCHDKIHAYASLERVDRLESQGYIWYENLPETFAFLCGGTVTDRCSLKRNMYAPLGNILEVDPLMACTPFYDLSTLNNIRAEFVRLLDSAHRSEEKSLQKFLEDNPILFRQFPAERIFFKSSVLTFF